MFGGDNLCLVSLLDQNNYTKGPMRKLMPAVLLASLAAALATAVIASGHESPKLGASAAASGTPWTTYYSALKSPRARAAESVSLPKGVPTDWGIDPASVHEVPTAADAPARVWLAMSAHGPCILASPNRLPYLSHPGEPGGGTCGGTALDDPPTLAFGGVLEGTGAFAKGGETVGIGLAPDGVARVTLHRADGSVENLPVQDNIYTFDSKTPTRSVSFSAAPTGAVNQEVRGADL